MPAHAGLADGDSCGIADCNRVSESQAPWQCERALLSSDHLAIHGVRRAGSAALDLAYTACGRLDGYWEFKLNSWDTAAGVLLVREAGGKVTYVDGSPFHLASAEVLATNGKIHASLIHLFQACLPDEILSRFQPRESLRPFAMDASRHRS